MVKIQGIHNSNKEQIDKANLRTQSIDTDLLVHEHKSINNLTDDQITTSLDLFGR